MTSPGPFPEHVILIPRVSTVRQKEENQLPLMQDFANTRGYITDAVIPINGKSAFHGRHLKQVLKAINEYIRQGNATVIIFRDVDRSSRQGAQATFDLRGEIIRAGGRMEFSGQEYLNDQRTQEMLLGLLATSAREESETKSRRTLQGNTAKALAGELTGKPSWGYTVGKVNGLRILVPNKLGREWVSRIYNLAAEGKSLEYIRNLLSANNVESPMKSKEWNVTGIRRLIVSPTYKGDRKGKGNMVYESLVSAELWQVANTALKTRQTGFKTGERLVAALVKPYCGACWGILRDGAAKNVKQPDGTIKLVPTGKSPMYRHTSYKYGRCYTYYICSGSGPAKQSCGAPAILESELDNAVNKIMSSDTRPHTVLDYIPGDDNAETIARLNDAIALAGREMNYTKVAELAAEAERVRQQPHRRGHAERRETGLTVGKNWDALNLAERREELSKWTVLAWPGSVRILGPWHDDGGTVIGEDD